MLMDDDENAMLFREQRQHQKLYSKGKGDKDWHRESYREPDQGPKGGAKGKVQQKGKNGKKGKEDGAGRR